MLIFLWGPDTFRSIQKLKELIGEYRAKHKSGLNFRRLDWQTDVFNEIKEALSSFSMFDEKKLIILKDACWAKKEEQEKLIDLLENKKTAKDDNAIMVFFETKKPAGSQLFGWLEEKSKMSGRFDYLTGAKLNNWAHQAVQSLGGQISGEALEKLVGFIGPDLWQMKNEIDKLVNFKAGKLIAEADVDLLVKSKYDPNIFATIDALAARNKSLAFKLMHQHLEQGENEIYILTMFVYQFRNLLQIKSLIEAGVPSSALAKKTGLHPFVIKKSWSQVRNFSQDVLKRIYEMLLKLDIAIKRGKIEPETALDLIVAEIAG